MLNLRILPFEVILVMLIVPVFVPAQSTSVFVMVYVGGGIFVYCNGSKSRTIITVNDLYIINSSRR
jgi:hypothetical protein